MRASRGFTLIELITVIVVVSIIAAVGSNFLVSAIETYRDTEQRAKLVQKGRLAIEQMTRELRLALPHSLRVSNSGACIEFIPIVGGATYLKPIAHESSGDQLKAISSIETSPVARVGLGTSEDYVAIGALSSAELYTTAEPSGLANLQSITSTSTPTVIQFDNHRFVRNSINQRLFITGSPVRFCLDGTRLWRYAGYGLDTTSPIGDSSPGGNAMQITSPVESAAGPVFSLSGGSQDRNTAVMIDLVFRQGASSVELNHQVLVRNVP